MTDYGNYGNCCVCGRILVDIDEAEIELCYECREGRDTTTTLTTAQKEVDDEQNHEKARPGTCP